MLPKNFSVCFGCFCNCNIAAVFFRLRNIFVYLEILKWINNGKMIWCRCAVIILDVYILITSWVEQQENLNKSTRPAWEGGKRNEIIRLDWISSDGGSTLTFTARLNIPVMKLDAIVVVSSSSGSRNHQEGRNEKEEKKDHKILHLMFLRLQRNSHEREISNLFFFLFIARLGPNLSHRCIVQVMIALLKQNNRV